MDQMRDRFCDYATVVKTVDPHALVLGPEEWGWTGYLYSGYDAQWGALHGWGSLPDRTAHGNLDLMPWWLGQIAQRSQSAGRRLLDVFTLHCYPQSGEYGNDDSLSTQLLRNRSTRSLWDTNYVDESWIATRVYLIPRMKAWVAANYPGTATGITEYNWGAETHMNGATAQADILGIFGRENLDLATRWTVPATNTPVAQAFQLYRNYNGTNDAFGETSVRAMAPDSDTVAAFAAVRSGDGALTIMLINKQPTTNAPVTVAFTNFTSVGVARVWQLATNTIVHLPDATIASNRMVALLPAQSITLLVLPAPPQLESPLANSTNRFTFLLRGETGQRYAVECSTNLASWRTLSTNTLASNITAVSFFRSNAWQFYRGVWLP